MDKNEKNLMPIKTEFTLYNALESVLKKQNRPMTCNELWDFPEVRERAQDVNRVSDYLGGLWRKGLVTRLPAPQATSGNARWAYAWKGYSKSAQQPGTPRPAFQQPVLATKDGQRVYSKPNIEVIDQGNQILIELPALSITIKLK